MFCASDNNNKERGIFMEATVARLLSAASAADALACLKTLNQLQFPLPGPSKDEVRAGRRRSCQFNNQF